MTRREFLRCTSAALLSSPVSACVGRMPVRPVYRSLIPHDTSQTLVNDVHSQLNSTRVARIVQPSSVDELAATIADAHTAGHAVAVAGGRHAMGGQQFVEDAVLVDTRRMNRVIDLDEDRGIVAVQAGIQWPELIACLQPTRWGIVQKQTGADRLSLAGALSANAHGRGLALKPIIDQVVEFDLVGPDGVTRTCSRVDHADLFRLAIGGYGLFGPITRVKLRRGPGRRVRRVVEPAETDGIIDRFEERIRNGYQYGDFQFTTDSTRDSFLRRGVLSCYQPVDRATPLTPNPTRFHPEDWSRLTFY